MLNRKYGNKNLKCDVRYAIQDVRKDFRLKQTKKKRQMKVRISNLGKVTVGCENTDGSASMPHVGDHVEGEAMVQTLS